MNYIPSVLHKIVSSVWICAPILAAIAWIVFLVNQLKLKNTLTEDLRKRRRCVRTVSLILAILFTLGFLLLCLCLMEAPDTPLPQSNDLIQERGRI